jgi:hypothetical protein
MYLMSLPQLTLYSVKQPLVRHQRSTCTGQSTVMRPPLPQATAVLEKLTRNVLALLLRGSGLRSDAMSAVLDDARLASGQTSSSALHVIRYRGPTAGAYSIGISLCNSTSSPFGANNPTWECKPPRPPPPPLPHTG